MTQTGQNSVVRPREEIESELQRLFTHGIRGPNAVWPVVHRIFDEVLAYGAEEQRRKDADATRYRIVRQRFLEDARNQGEDLTAEQFDAKVDGDTEARATLIRAEESTQTAAMEDRANAEIEKWSL